MCCFVFVVIVSPLVIRYTLSTSGQDNIFLPSANFWSVSSDWGAGLTILEWVILVTLAMQNFMGLVPITSVLSGKPTCVRSGANVQCSGSAVIGTCTPFLTENEAIFLRSLLGRFATAFHTMGSRHDLTGFYVDAIVNEVRCKEDDPRLLQWMAWVDFIEFLAGLKTEDMSWPFSLTVQEDGTAIDYTLATAVPLLSINDDEEDGYIHKNLDPSPVIRDLQLGGRKVTYELDTTNLTFKGVKTVSINEKIDNDKHEPENQSNSSDGNKIFFMNDLLPLVCFIDGWLEVTRRRDLGRDHNNKKYDSKLFCFDPLCKFILFLCLLVLANCNEIILLFCCPGWLWRIFSTSRRAPSSLADLP